MMSWLLETGKGEAVTSAFGTEIDAHPRSRYVASEEGLLDWEFIWVHTNILSIFKTKRNWNKTVLDYEL